MANARITLTTLRELWVHTGTACNLECPFCLEGSKPGDARLERVTLAELKPHLDEAAQLGIERFVFTGGEPLIVKDIVKILQYTLQLKPCLLLTNGTAPLIKRAHQLHALKQQPHALSFRISIDHPNEQLHDAERGWGNFKRAIEGMRLLFAAGFPISIARHSRAQENATEVHSRYRELLIKNRLPESTEIVAWPEFGRPHIGPAVALPTQTEVDAIATPTFCAYSRMLVKRANALRVHACPFTDDDVRFDLGDSLGSSLDRAVELVHARCGQCVRRGANLGGIGSG